MIIKIAAFTAISCFYIAYFAKQILLRKKGIKTNRLTKGDKSRQTATIEKWLLAATYGTAVIQYASIFFLEYMLPLPFPAVVRWVGLAVAVCGVLFFVLAITVMRDNWRAGVDESQKTVIVTAGIYKVSRNPAFMGFDLLYIGSALATPNVLMCIAAVFGVVLLHLQILEEEKFLPSVFGNGYAIYKENTPRYFLFF